LHPGTIIVYDNMASATPRAWEWNLHAVDKMTKVSEKKVHVRNGPAQMCVELVLAPDVTFNQTDQYTAPPSGKWQKEWHGSFAASAKSPAAEFLAVMRIGVDCSAKAAGVASVTRAGDALQLALDGKTVTFTGDSVAVR
jgi:hypothetical protein